MVKQANDSKIIELLKSFNQSKAEVKKSPFSEPELTLFTSMPKAETAEK